MNINHIAQVSPLFSFNFGHQPVMGKSIASYRQMICFTSQTRLNYLAKKEKRTDNYQIHFNEYCASSEIEAVNFPDCLNELMAPPVVII